MTVTPVGMRCPECSKQTTKVKRVHGGGVALPRATYALIFLNVAAFLTEKGQFSVYGTGIEGQVIAKGVLVRCNIAVSHEYWRLVSSAFLHENLLHIGFNMYLLYVLGMMLEPAIGTGRFVAIYFTALLAGSCGALVATGAPSLGASGAIFGLMGAAAVELRARRLSIMESGIGGLIVLNLILSFTLANISVGAHVGGLIGGALAAFTLRAADSRRVPLLGYLGCLAIAVGSVAGALAAAAGSTAGCIG
jgi:membrane associated rhomboid family serine protease